MRALIIDGEVKANIAKVLELAKAKPVLWEQVREIAIDTDETTVTLADRKPGFKPMGYSLVIPNGYRVWVSYEQQPAGMCKHISVGLDGAKAGKVPAVEAFKMICEAFGIIEAPDKVWVEEYEPGEYAINAIQIVSEMEVGDGSGTWLGTS